MVALGDGQRPELELGDTLLPFVQFVLGPAAIADVLDGPLVFGPEAGAQPRPPLLSHGQEKDGGDDDDSDHDDRDCG